jgi:competence protein ComEA
MARQSLRFLGAVLIFTLAVLVLAPAAARGASPQPPPSTEKVNINTAGVDELVALPGIGKAYAERIVEYRQKNGPFKRVEDILNVRGIGEKTFERIKDRLTLGKS